MNSSSASLGLTEWGSYRCFNRMPEWEDLDSIGVCPSFSVPTDVCVNIHIYVYVYTQIHTYIFVSATQKMLGNKPRKHTDFDIHNTTEEWLTPSEQNYLHLVECVRISSKFTTRNTLQNHLIVSFPKQSTRTNLFLPWGLVQYQKENPENAPENASNGWNPTGIATSKLNLLGGFHPLDAFSGFSFCCQTLSLLPFLLNPQPKAKPFSGLHKYTQWTYHTENKLQNVN